MAQGPSDTILVAIWITLRIRSPKSEIRILRIAVFGRGLCSVSISSFLSRTTLNSNCQLMLYVLFFCDKTLNICLYGIEALSRNAALAMTKTK